MCNTAGAKLRPSLKASSNSSGALKDSLCAFNASLTGQCFHSINLDKSETFRNENKIPGLRFLR